MDTQDIFDPKVGTLDIIVYAVLAHLMLPCKGLYGDEQAAENATRFVEYFGDKQILAIKTIRQVSGLPLRDARDAWFQVIETYYGDREYLLLRLRRAGERGDKETALYLARQL